MAGQERNGLLQTQLRDGNHVELTSAAGTPSVAVVTVQGDPAGTPIPTSGTVTANQGTQGTQAWLTRAAVPGAAAALVTANPVAITPLWSTSADQTILNAAGQAGYDNVRLGINIIEGTAVNISVVEVMLELYDGTNWQEAEEALDLTGVPVAGVLLTPSYARRRTFTTAAAGTTTRSWTVALPAASQYRISARETNAACVATACTISGTQFKG